MSWFSEGLSVPVPKAAFAHFLCKEENFPGCKFSLCKRLWLAQGAGAALAPGPSLEWLIR